MIQSDELLSIKELAWKLGRSREYIRAMRRRGFRMPGNRATLSDALIFLEENPMPMRVGWQKVVIVGKATVEKYGRIA